MFKGHMTHPLLADNAFHMNVDKQLETFYKKGMTAMVSCGKSVWELEMGSLMREDGVIKACTIQMNVDKMSSFSPLQSFKQIGLWSRKALINNPSLTSSNLRHPFIYPAIGLGCWDVVSWCLWASLSCHLTLQKARKMAALPGFDSAGGHSLLKWRLSLSVHARSGQGKKSNWPLNASCWLS